MYNVAENIEQRNSNSFFFGMFCRMLFEGCKKRTRFRGRNTGANGQFPHEVSM